MRTLILNSTNIVENTNNSVFEYSFPAGNVEFKKGSKAALASVQMYYSTFNLTAANNNNKFTYTWIDGTVVSVTFTDGFYDADGINDFLHFTMVQNGHYLVEVSTGNFYYFINFSTNANLYAIQADFFPIGQDLYATPATYTIPTGTSPLWTNPAAGPNERTPTITIPATAFRNIIGFAAGTYGTQTVGTTTSLSVVSTITPQITPLSSFVLTCSLLNNNFAVPNTLLYSFSPQGTFGEQFTIAPNEYAFIDIQGGFYNTFRVEFLDQNLFPVSIQDPQMVILINIDDIGDHAI